MNTLRVNCKWRLAIMFQNKYGELPELGSGGSGGKGSNFCDPFLISTGLLLLPVSIVPWLRLLFKAFLFFNTFSPTHI